MAGQILTAEYLRSILHYDPLTGVFRWSAPRPKIRVGDVAGGIDADGYNRIRIDGRKYAAHRLAWFYMHGVWPPHDIDHRHGARSDNRLSELRPLTRLHNIQNQRSARINNKTGMLGVSPKGQRWAATIMFNYKKKHIGYFDTPEEAHAAYLAAKAVHHEFQTLIEKA